MDRVTRLSKQDLQSRYPDGAWGERLLHIINLTQFLDECILKRNYKIPDALNEAIILSDFGRRVHHELVTKHDVPAKEARVLCLLAAAYTEPLIDVEQTDISELSDTISKQTQDGSILFPFIFGRELYDRAAELFQDERHFLNYEDTLRLLEGTSQGVFQLGHSTIGPYGVLESPVSRYLVPTTRIPLYHCSELTCEVVHSCRLSTDTSASINEHFPKIYRVLQKEAPEPWAWGDFFGDIMGRTAASYDDLSLATLPHLIGDGLTDTELRSLLEYLMDETGGAFRSLLTPLKLRGKASDALAELDRAQMMQLALLNADAAIIEALDRLVLNKTIVIPEGEIRRPVLHRAVTSGQFGLQVQLGRYGYRVHSVQADLGPLRLRRLVDGLYLLDEESDVTELEWQLREVDAPTLASRLDEYVRTFTPEQVVRRLVLARRTNMISACTSLGIDEHRTWSDEDLIGATLWKLDFMPATDRDGAKRFWQVHERMKQVTQTAGVSALVDQEAVRALASNYFVLLEEFLDDCLAFSVWALTNDHISSPRPFSYRASEESGRSFEKLAEYESSRDSGPETVRFSGKNTLYELARGFGSLAGLLRTHAQSPEASKRGENDFPKFAAHTGLKHFPFRHRVPFLDLRPESQSVLLDVLDDVGRTLVAADVSGVRNDQLHFRRSTADLGRLSECLNAVESSARRLEQSGLTRLLFRPLREQADEWGRRIFTLVDPRGREIAVARPSSYDWLLLPGLRSAQYLMTSAVFAEPNEFLRFREDISSEFAKYWDGYPARRSQASATTLMVPGMNESPADMSRAIPAD